MIDNIYHILYMMLFRIFFRHHTVKKIPSIKISLWWDILFKSSWRKDSPEFEILIKFKMNRRTDKYKQNYINYDYYYYELFIINSIHVLKKIILHKISFTQLKHFKRLRLVVGSRNILDEMFTCFSKGDRLTFWSAFIHQINQACKERRLNQSSVNE